MKFRRQTCIYCQSRPSTPTGDHVFARGFFLEDRRGNLPKVPACKVCGDEKSRLEQYLMTILPFGGRHVDAPMNLTRNVPGRLEKNQKLNRRLSAERSNIWVKLPSGLLTRTFALPIDTAKLEQLFALIVRALMWHHWRVVLSSDCFIGVHLPSVKIERIFASLSAMNARVRVSENLGNGTFVYAGSQGIGNETISVWEFLVYGGVAVTGDGPNETISKIRALTGPVGIRGLAERSMTNGILT